MSIFTKLGVDVAAPVDAAGNPRSVVNHDMQVWMTEMERAAVARAVGAITFGTLSEAQSSLGYAEWTTAWVINDPAPGNNGWFTKTGASGSGSWVRLGDLPYSYIKATNAGAGTANAIVATTASPIPVADGGALIALNITDDNTASPVTVAFNGGAALTIKSNTGSDIAAGSLTAGMVVAGYVVGSTFRLLSDQTSAALLAQMEVLYEEFNALFLGAKSVAPTLDNNGDALQSGALYYNTSDGILYVYDGTAWEPMNSSLADGSVTDAKIAAPATPADGINSDKIKFLQLGTGAVARSAMDKLRESVSVRDFYSASDSGDWGLAFQRTLDHVQGLAAGGEITVPSGDYEIITPVKIPKVLFKTTLIRGSGQGSRIRCENVSGGDYAFSLNEADVSGGSIGLYLRDLHFRGDFSTWAGLAINANKANALDVDSCFFSYLERPFNSTRSYAVRISKTLFSRITHSAWRDTSSCHNLIFTQNNCYLVGTAAGDAVVRSEADKNVNIVIDNNDIEYCTRVASFVAGVDGLSVRGNFIEGLTYGFLNFGAESVGIGVEFNDINQCVDYTFANVKGGTFKYNALFNQNVAFSLSADMDVGANKATGTTTIGAAPWQTPSSYLNSWGAGARSVGYRIANGNLLSLKGEISGGATNTAAFTLPVGYRPRSEVRVAASGFGGAAAMLIISTAGAVTPIFSTGTIVNLDGVVVPID